MSEEPKIVLNKRQLADLLNWINTLSNTVGLKTETYNDVIQAIDKANGRLTPPNQ